MSPSWMDGRLSQKSHDEQAALSHREKKDIDWDQYNPPENWKAELAHFFKQKVPDSLDENNILKNIKRHTDGDTPISKNITKYFKMIYAIMTKKMTPAEAGVQFDPDNNVAVAGTIDNIIEGLPYCSDGTFERVKTVYDRWTSSISLHGFLMDFRTELVENLARANFGGDKVGSGMETHRLNFYKVVANEEGINVSGAVEGKHYKDRLDIATRIKAEIKKNYTPIGIVKYIEDRLRGLVPEFTLPKKNAEEFQQAFQIRLVAHNDIMKKILESLFDALQIKMPETVADYLITKKIILSHAPPDAFIAYENINWAAIRKLIIQSLCEQNVVKDDAKKDEKNLLKPSIENKSELLYWYHNIASDDDTLEFFNHLFFDYDKYFFLYAIYNSDAKPDRLIKAMGDDYFKKKLVQLSRNPLLPVGSSISLCIIALYYYRWNEHEDLQNKNEREKILTQIEKELDPNSLGPYHLKENRRIFKENIQIFIYTISQLSDIEVRVNVITEIAMTYTAKSLPDFWSIYLPQLLNFTNRKFQIESILRLYQDKNTVSGIKGQDNMNDIESLIKIMSSFKNDELKMLFLHTRNFCLIGGQPDKQKIIDKIIEAFGNIKDPVLKKKLFLELFQHLPKDLKIQILSILNEKEILSQFLFAKSDIYLHARDGFALFLKACDEETLNAIFLEDNPLSRSIAWDGVADADILNHLKLPAVRVQYLKNMKENKHEQFLLTKTHYFQNIIHLEQIVSQMIKEENREFVKPFMDLMGGIGAYIDTNQKQPNVYDLIKLIKLLPEYADPLIAKIGGMQKFIEIVTTAVAADNNANLLTEALENLPASTRNSFLTEDNNMGMIRSVELLLLHNNFQTFFINILNTLSDEQKIAIVDLLATKCFVENQAFTHFEDPERLLAILPELPNQAREILIEGGGVRMAALFEAMTIDQQSKLLSLLTNKGRMEFFENDVKLWEPIDKNNLQGLLPLIPLNILERHAAVIQNAINNKIISLPEVINILKTHQPELTQAQIISLFLNADQKEMRENEIDLSAIAADQPIFNLVKNLQELILLIQTVCGADNLKDKMTHWLTQFPDGLQLIKKLFDDSESTERYSQLSMLLPEDYLSQFINIDHRIKLQDILNILSSLPDKQHRESIFHTAMSRGNQESDIQWLVNLVQEQPYKLTALLSLLPDNLANTLVDTLIRKQIISTGYWQNQLSEEGRPCHDLAIICKYSKENRKKKSLLNSCGGLAAISTQANRLIDLIELINAVDPTDYAEDCKIDVSQLLANQKDFHQLFNETKTLHYSLLLRSIDPRRYIKSTEDLVNFFKQINPNKLQAIIETPSAFRDYIIYLSKNAIIREMLTHLPVDVRAKWMQAYQENFQESAQFRGGRVIASPKSFAYELAAKLAHCHTDFEKDCFIRMITMEKMADSIRTPDELAALLNAFPDDPSYSMAQLPENLADPTDPENYDPGKIYLYIFHDEISGKNELDYTVLSRDEKRLCNGTLEFDGELPETITPEFIDTLKLETVLQQTSQNGYTLNANKAQLIQALPEQLQNDEAVKRTASAAKPNHGAAPAAKAASAGSGSPHFFKERSADTQEEKTKASAPHMKK